MPAEWRALSRLEGKHIYRSSVPSISEAKGKSSNVKANIDLLWNEESDGEEQRNQDEGNTQQYLKSGQNCTSE